MVIIHPDGGRSDRHNLWVASSLITLQTSDAGAMRYVAGSLHFWNGSAWMGVVAVTGGSALSITPSAGGVLYSTSTALAVNTPGTQFQLLKSGGTGAPTWASWSINASHHLLPDVTNSFDVGSTSLRIRDVIGRSLSMERDTTAGQIACLTLTTSGVPVDNTTHRMSPQIAFVAKIWDGSGVLSRTVAMQVEGISGVNDRYALMIGSSHSWMMAVGMQGGLHVGTAKRWEPQGVVDAQIGFRVNDVATTGQYLRGNGTNFVSSGLLAADLTGTIASARLSGGYSGINQIGTLTSSLKVDFFDPEAFLVSNGFGDEIFRVNTDNGVVEFGSNLEPLTTLITIGVSSNPFLRVYAERLSSTIATGTSPLTVTSTTRVDNLTAHYLGAVNQDASYFLNRSVPVGGIIALDKDILGTPALPATFVECNGQVISDAESPINGTTVPNLNGSGGTTKRFLRGHTASGATGGSETHTHGISTTSLSVSSGTGATVINSVTSPSNATSTLPSYYEVVWVKRIK